MATTPANTTHPPAGDPANRLAAWLRVGRRYLYPYRPRSRSWHFWAVQGLVVLVALLHTLVEYFDYAPAGIEIPSIIPISMFFIPVVYAALNFGLAGSVATAIWCTILSIPNLVLTHPGADRIAEAFQLGIVDALALFVGHRVEREMSARRGAEAAGAALGEKEEQLRTLLAKVLRAQEDERKRVSRELHDGVGQALSALSMGLQRIAEARQDEWPKLQGEVAELKGLASDTLTDLRRMTIALRPAALDDLGLVPAIRRYVELYAGNAGVRFQLQDEGLDPRPDSALDTIVYRVVQEAVNNVIRHSQGTRLQVSLQTANGTIIAIVEDNGIGFDPTSPASQHGVGLQGMRERASLAGGTLTVHSQPGHGTVVRLEIPAGSRNHSP